MNVSSVKNLNGETFSAVQDAALTDVVQTNSGVWNDISAYQTNSATYLTAHQAISANEWNSNYDTVTTNSGAWGGSALNISAGNGVKVELVDNTLVFSNDETVLWSGNAGYGEMPITLSESMDNFENIEFTWIPRYNGDYGSPTRVDKFSTNSYNGRLQWTLGGFYNNAGSNWIGYVYLSANDTSTVLAHSSSFYINPTTTASPGNNLAFRVCKIVGINRIAGGN